MKNNEQLLLRAKEGDKSAKEQLVNNNMGLVHHIVRRFTGRGVETEDLIQIGSIGLLKAIDDLEQQSGTHLKAGLIKAKGYLDSTVNTSKARAT